MSTRLHDWNLDDAAEREAMLTAHALGELDDDAAAAMEARLAEDPGLRAELEAIRAVAGELEAAFAADPAAGSGLDAERRAAVDAGAGADGAAGAGGASAASAAEPKDAGTPPAPPSTLTWIRRRLPVVGGGLAAAAVLGFTAIVVLDGGGVRTGADGMRDEVAIARAPEKTPMIIEPDAEGDAGSGRARGGGDVAAEEAATAEADGPRGGGSLSFPWRREALPSAAAPPAEIAAAAAPDPAGMPARIRDLPDPQLEPPPPPAAAAPRALAGQPSTGDAWIPSSLPDIRRPQPEAFPEASREHSERLVDNDWTPAAEQPLSTFSVDVDTAAYANVRRFLETGTRPPRDAVRIEELINAFDYDYPVPAAGDDHPFTVSVDAGPAPWAEDHRLVRVGLQGFELSMDERPAANLVFLIDVSGSMRARAKLPLVKAGLRMLLRELGPSDRVAIVTYAGRAGLILDSTAVTDSGRAAIEAAIDGLSAGGSTNGAGGIDLAYRVAAAHRIGGGTNRVVLCTDGDFNVGASGPDALQRLIEDRRDEGVFLNVMGFGTGNYQDGAMERLSNHGNGIAAYIDSIREAEKVFVRGAVGALVTIAKDVKLQVDFNPGRVQAYRLIGYANRMLAAEDFADDRVDAGEIGAGHTVTALYEIVPVGVDMPRRVEGSKYVRPAAAAGEAGAGAGGGAAAGAGETGGPATVDSPELLTVRVRYKQPEGETSVRFDTPFTDPGHGLAETSADFRFAASVAGFGLLLRDSDFAGSLDWDLLETLATPGLAQDPHGDRREFLGLVRAARVAGD